MNDRIEVGLIGYGSSARVFHLPFLLNSPQFLLTTISHRTGPKPTLPIPIKFLNVEEVINSTVELIIICTTNESHFAIARDALLKVEKPLTVTSAESSELIVLAKLHKVVLSCFHNRRLDGDFKTVQKLIDEGQIGRIVRFESRFERFRIQPKTKDAWREMNYPGSGILYDIGSHLFDQTIQIFGPPLSISCTLRHQRGHSCPSPPPDYFMVTFNYPDLVVVMSASMIARGPMQRYLGTFIKFGLDVQEIVLKSMDLSGPPPEDLGVEPSSSNGILYSNDFEEHIVTENGNYRAFYLNLFEAIRNNGELLVKAEEAGFVVRMIEIAMESASEGITVRV